MKKLMVLAAAVAVSAAANAAAVTWTTGNMKLAANGTGTFGSATPAFNSGNVTISATLWYLTETALKDYATISTDTQGNKSVTAVDSAKLYKAMKDGTLGDATKSFDNIATTGTIAGKNTAAASWKDDGGYSDQKLFGALLLEYSDEALEKDFYIANAGVANVAASNISVPSLALKVGGTGSDITAWSVAESVPEPTSGLLLLLGVAGLALKRRRA